MWYCFPTKNNWLLHLVWRTNFESKNIVHFICVFLKPENTVGPPLVVGIGHIYWHQQSTNEDALSRGALCAPNRPTSMCRPPILIGLILHSSKRGCTNCSFWLFGCKLISYGEGQQMHNQHEAPVNCIKTNNMRAWTCACMMTETLVVLLTHP